MSGILYAVGALTAVVGLLMTGFGIPVKEFSFGNTLIQAGVTAIVGGLIIAALGVVTAQLQRLAEALTAKAPIRSTRPMDMFEAARAARVPFPAKPKTEAHEPFAHMQRAEDAAHDQHDDNAVKSFAPSLRNPEESHVTVEDDVSLSPQQRPAETEEPAPQAVARDHDEPEMPDHRQEEALDAGWRPASRPAARPAPSYFDAAWPADTKDAKPASSRAAEDDYKPFAPKPFDPKPFEPKPLFDPKPYEPKSAEPKFDLPHHEEPAPEPEPEMHVEEYAVEEAAQPVAILKSGVVDGMAYTLYVDGSIEAELPQGTLRFASINELRAHLEKGT